MRSLVLGAGTIVIAAFVACGGKLADDETVSTTTFGTPVPPDAGSADRDSSYSPPTVDIASLSGLALWLDATEGVTVGGSNNVIAWADQSPEHNDLKVHDGIGARVNGSLGLGASDAPAVQFDGKSSYEIAPTAKLANWWGDFYVVAVVHPNVFLDHDIGIFGCYGAQPDVPGHTMAQFYFTDDHRAWTDIESNGNANGVASSVLDDTAVVVSFRRDGVQIEARRNGVVEKVASCDPDVTTPRCTQAFVGALPSDGTAQTDALYDGALAELVVVQSWVSPDTASTIEAQLMAKYLLAH